MTRSIRAVAPIVPIIVLLSACLPTPPSPVCVGFSAPLVPGTSFGAAAGNAPGDLAFTESGVAVKLESFLQSNGSTAFNVASIDNIAVLAASPPSMRFNNIAARFDFTGLSFVPSAVKVSYADFGGSENIAANGAPATAGDIPGFQGINTGGAAVTVTQVSSNISSRSGVIEVSGGVKDLLIGGQELWIDEVCAVP
ncbi:MAG: hypothetical protein RLZZ528_2711 [Pseudomonadota bacterium]